MWIETVTVDQNANIINNNNDNKAQSSRSRPKLGSYTGLLSTPDRTIITVTAVQL